MIAAFVIIFILMAAMSAFIYVASVHLSLKREYEEEEWMDTDQENKQN